jgi:hypothetical protein
MPVSDRARRVMRPFLDFAFLPWRTGWAILNRVGWLGSANVGLSPHLPENSLKRWREILGRTSVYLEFGSGGSTDEAAGSVSILVSVETDRQYLSAVEQSVRDRHPGVSFYPLFIDIGWTQKWGRPLIRTRTRSRLAKWRNYTSAPWALFEELGRYPDFIFIDGRFRAASALESMLQLPQDAKCTFMLDDFDRRKIGYGEILQFADDVEFVDRAVIFRKSPTFDVDKCAQLLRKYQTDPE